MAHLGHFRAGWTSERLAELALSGISFVGKPTTVADDLGADFYCTLIERRSVSGRTHLFPTSPFVVQVKSSASKISLTKHLHYLKRLEAPFFIGIADSQRLTLTLYSGRYLPFLLALKGDRPKSVTVRLTRQRKVSRHTIEMAAASPLGRIRLPMPRLVTLRASSTEQQRNAWAATLHAECEDVALANQHRLSGQYVLPFPGTKLRAIFAGRATTKNFRRNFEDRLSEYMRNMEWIKDKNRNGYRVTEARAILAAAQQIQHWLPNTPLFRRILKRFAGALR